MRKRYLFGISNEVELFPGMWEASFTDDFNQRYKPFEEEIKNDIREYLDAYEPSILPQLEFFKQGLENTADPGIEFLRELVEMMRLGLATKIKPKMLALVKDSGGNEVVPAIDLQWHHGLEDAVTRLSEKFVNDAINEISFRRVGRDFNITFRVDVEQNSDVVQDLVEELKEWN